MPARRIAPALAVCLLLAGCAPGTVVPVFGLGGLDIAAFHRSLPDMAYSLITGHDCSVVRLDRGESYCKQIEPPPPPQPYCTRSLGTVDCWAAGAAMPNQAPQVAQGPTSLTPTQEWWRTAPWPATLRGPPYLGPRGPDPQIPDQQISGPQISGQQTSDPQAPGPQGSGPPDSGPPSSGPQSLGL